MYQPFIKSCIIALLCCWLGGCVAVAAGGVATGAVVASDRRTTGTVVEDQAIETKASRAFNSNAALDEKTHINVISYNTRVLMTGEAPSEELRQQAEAIVRSIPKVSEVYNEIVIAAPSSFMSRSSDSVITTKVKTALFGELGLDANQTKVVTERGIVYLMGLLTPKEGERVVEVTRRVGGVQKVVKLYEIYQQP